MARATGLVNLGNTCFVNAVLQLLSNTQPLRRYFISNSHVRRLACAWALEERRATESDARSGVSERCAARFDMCIEFGVLLKALWKGYEHVSPVAFLVRSSSTHDYCVMYSSTTPYVVNTLLYI